MNEQFHKGHFFQDGGTLPPDMPSYIVRSADAQLRECISRGDFAFVLAPRQMGKSSLMARMVDELKKKEHHAAVVDLTKIGESGTADAASWYRGLLRLIARELKIAFSIKEWWQEREGITNQQIFYEFFADVVLPACNGKITIFVDEIDATIPLPFSDDFFTGIRALYNARATEAEFKRISFVLLGVATPAELISDTRRTPFNIGVSIDLTDFSVEEAMPLVAGLAGNREENAAVIRRILYWTGGHPYLTQRVCTELVQQQHNGWTADKIDALVDGLYFVSGKRSTDNNLSFVTTQVLGSKYQRHMLGLYKKVLSGKTITHDPRSVVQAEIKLSGLLCVGAGNILRIRNNVYLQVFNQKWVREMTTIGRVPIVGISGLALLLAVLLFWYLVLLPQPYIKGLELADRGDAAAAEAYDKLQRIPGKRHLAGKLMAAVWEKNGVRTEIREKPQPALLCWLKAVKYNDTQGARCEAGRVAASFRELDAVLRHKGTVYEVAFSHDGSMVATVSNDRTARIWDAGTGYARTEPLQHRGSVYAVAFSPDDSIIVTAGDDTLACMWDVSTGRRITSLKHHDAVKAVVFSPDGSRLATASNDNMVNLWDVKTGKPVILPLKHESNIKTIMFSSDGATIATITNGQVPRLWNAATGRMLAQPIRQKKAPVTVAFSPDGSRIAFANYDKTVCICNTLSRKLLVNPMKHAALVHKVAFSPDGSKIIAVCDDNTTCVWNAITGQLIGGVLKHENPVDAVTFSPDGSRIAAVSSDNTARIWYVSTGDLLAGPMRHEGIIMAVTFSPDGLKLATASDDNTTRIWNEFSGKPFGAQLKPEYTFQAVAFASQGLKIATVHSGKTVSVWDLPSRKSLSYHLQHDDSIKAVAFSPDGFKAATASDDKTVRLWDIATGKQLGYSLTHDGNAVAVAFSPDGLKLATASDDKTARLWELATGKQLGSSLMHEGSVNAVAFSPDGSRIVTASDDKAARIWNAATCELTGLKLTHEGPVNAVNFSPDGAMVATASDDKTACIWETATGKACAKPLRHDGSVKMVMFSPDGKYLITATNTQLNYFVLKTSSYFGMKTISPVPIASRTLPSRSKAIISLDASDSCVVVPWGIFRNGLVLDTIAFFDHGLTELEGDIDSLLEKWQQKLALKITANGEIESLYQDKR